MKDILPDENYWKNLGFEDLRKVVGNLNGIRVRKGVTGWSTEDLMESLIYTGESNPKIIRQPRDILPGMLSRQAPKCTKFLTLISKFVEGVKPYAIKKIAEQIGIQDGGFNKNSLVLKIFFHDSGLLKSIQLQSLTSGLQRTHPYWTIEKLTKSRVISKKFERKFLEELQNAPSLSERRIRVRMETTRGSDSVTFFIEHEDDERVVNEWEGRHYDRPKKWTIVSFYTKLQSLEVRTTRKKVLDDTVKIFSSICFGKKTAFLPFSEDSEDWANEVDINTLGITLEKQILRSLTANSVNLEGSPNLTIEGADITPAIRQLTEHKGIELTDISGWGVHLSIKKDGIVKEVTVNKKSRKSQLSLSPVVPIEFRSFVYLLHKKNLIPCLK